MLDKYPMRKYTTSLKFKAAQKYNISPEKCHLGHVILQGLLENPEAIHQVRNFILLNNVWLCYYWLLYFKQIGRYPISTGY